ncbi:MAG: helix-turn-helix domain-containing protein [Streptococcaceae bacterium]|jgi:mannitol operon transcriptional antiterminator|nr:helix-turn-helix domain-containing protein [Streptococcaceae bacterium]
MQVTSREQKLIDALLNNKTMSIQEMLAITKTSRRTLYRDLEGLQLSLPKEVQLLSSSLGYFLEGDLTLLTHAQTIDWTFEERLYGELLLLLFGQGSIKDFDEHFGISQPTATADLKIIEQNLKELGLTLSRESGLKVLGDERLIRQVLVSILTRNVSTMTLFSTDFSKSKWLSFMDTTYLQKVIQAFSKVDTKGMSDKTQSILIFFFFVSLLRMEENHFVEIKRNTHPSKLALAFVQKVTRTFTGTKFTIAEITYLAGIADILHFSSGRDILYLEKVDTEFSYKIRKIIEEVGQSLSLAFEKDTTLYGLLYTHLKTTNILSELFIGNEKNDFAKSIQTTNEKLYEAVNKALTKAFHKQFSANELAYVTLHFAATLERSDLVLPLKAALITDRGQVYSEFLVSNLKKNFPFVKQIEIIKSTSKFNEASFDAIFSTQSHPSYIKVNKVLNQENLDAIRHSLRKIQHNRKPRIFEEEPHAYMELTRLFQVGDQIIHDFSIQTLNNQDNLHDVIEKIATTLPFKEQEKISMVLEKNFETTPFGLPDTNIALLHGVCESITQPYFAIFDLQKSVRVLSMDKSEIHSNRMLLLLAPMNVESGVQYLLGKISSSIIENKLYTTIYKSGNVEVVTELLRQIITEAIQNYGK